MSIIRSLDELNEFLSNNLSWRKKELTTLNFMVSRSCPHERDVLLRGSICLLYAHWEGFIRDASTSYICFVVSQGLRFRDLAPNFIALGLLPNISQIQQTRFATVHSRLTINFTSQLSEQFSLDCEKAINTRSNINSKIFEEICQIIGIKNANYASKNNLLDERLLGNRNRVSHGRRLEIDSNDYVLLHDTVVELIEKFRTDVEKAAECGTYRASSTDG